MSRKNGTFWVLAVLCLLALSACNLNDATPSPEMIYTQAAQTAVAAQMQTAMAVTSTPQATPTLQDGSSQPTNTPLITNTFTPGAATNTSIPLSTLRPTQAGVCDNAEFVDDVTIPDYSEVPAGSGVIKTWRFKNLGPCTWTTGYHVVFSYMSDTGKDGVLTPPGPAAFPNSVEPGETVDLTVTITAPTKADGYILVFRLQNDKGFNFGAEFWAIFVVK